MFFVLTQSPNYALKRTAAMVYGIHLPPRDGAVADHALRLCLGD
jgi:hypothetical protein